MPIYKDYLTIRSDLNALSTNANYGSYCQLIDASTAYNTVGSKRFYYAKVKGVDTDYTPAQRIGVIITGGIHGDELAPPEAILNFIDKLVKAYYSKSAIIYNAFVYNFDEISVDPNPPNAVTVIDPAQQANLAEWQIPYSEIKNIMEKLEIYFVPVVNPDGHEYALTVANNWRKNRKPLGGTDIGVDLNRNFGPSTVWNYQNYYTPAVLATTGINKLYDVSSTPSENTFHGPSESSEQETLFMENLILTTPFNFFLDIHSDGHCIGYPWGCEHDKNINDTKNFHSSLYDQAHTYAYLSTPGEFFDDSNTNNLFLLTRHHRIAKTMQRTILQMAGRGTNARRVSKFRVDQMAALSSAAPGNMVDFACDKQFSYSGIPNVSNKKHRNMNGSAPIYAFAFESGSEWYDGRKNPDANQFKKVERETHAGIFALLKYAANWDGF